MRINEIYTNAAAAFSHSEIDAKLLDSNTGLIHLISEYKVRRIDTIKLVEHIAKCLVITHLTYVKNKGYYEDMIIYSRVDKELDSVNPILLEIVDLAFIIIIILYQVDSPNSFHRYITDLKEIQSKMMLAALMLISEDKIKELVNNELENLQNETISRT